MNNIFKSIKIQWKPLIVNLLIAWGVAALSAFLTPSSKDIFNSLVKPPLSPPAWLFPVVWGILYTLMGISAYLIYASEVQIKSKIIALTVYGLQLFMNFLWSLIFFNLHAYLFSFIWLVILWVIIIVMIVLFWRIKPIAGIMQIPYLLWVTFAGYLNLMIWILNK